MNPFALESCGQGFLAPQPRNALLSFAPTQTGLHNSKFYGSDPRPDYIFPRPDQIETI